MTVWFGTLHSLTLTILQRRHTIPSPRRQTLIGQTQRCHTPTGPQRIHAEKPLLQGCERRLLHPSTCCIHSSPNPTKIVPQDYIITFFQGTATYATCPVIGSRCLQTLNWPPEQW